MMVMVCHRTMCQRATGSAFSVEPVFLKSRWSFEANRLPSIAIARLTMAVCCTSASAKRVAIGLALLLERFPTTQIVYAGTFDDRT